MKKQPKAVYIIENGGYTELTYEEFRRREQICPLYADKLFLPLYGRLIVAAITSRKTKTALPTHVAIMTGGLKTESTVLLEQIRTIDKARLGEYIGKIDSKTLAAVDRAIVVSLGIKYLEGLLNG